MAQCVKTKGALWRAGGGGRGEASSPGSPPFSSLPLVPTAQHAAWGAGGPFFSSLLHTPWLSYGPGPGTNQELCFIGYLLTEMQFP